MAKPNIPAGRRIRTTTAPAKPGAPGAPQKRGTTVTLEPGRGPRGQIRARVAAPTAPAAADARLDAIESFADLGAFLKGELDQRDERLEQRFQAIEDRFGSVDGAGDHLDDRDAELRAEIYDGDPLDEGVEHKLTPEEVRDYRPVWAMIQSKRGWPGTSKDSIEYLMHQQLRALNASDDAAGGVFVPTEVRNDRFIRPLEAQSIVLQLGATVLGDLSGDPVEIPRETGTPSAAWEGENTPSVETDDDFNQERLTPHRCTGWIRISKRLARMASLDVQAIITQRLVTALRLKLDIAALKGTGASGQPVGVVTRQGVNAVDWSSATGGASQTISGLLEKMDEAIELDNAQHMVTAWGYAMHPATKRKLKSYLDADGRPLYFSASVADAGVGRRVMLFNDRAFQTSTQLSGGAAGDLILGGWNHLLVGLFGPISMDENDRFEEVWKRNQTAIKVEMEADIGVEHPEAFCIANGFNVA